MHNLTHAQTVCTRLSFPPPPLESLGTRLCVYITVAHTALCVHAGGENEPTVKLHRSWLWKKGVLNMGLIQNFFLRRGNTLSMCHMYVCVHACMCVCGKFKC